MQQCTHSREYLALRPDAPDQAAEAHIRTCSACKEYARRSQAFDTAIKSAVLPAVPAELSAQLLALIPGLQTDPVRSPRWQRQRRLFLLLSALLTVCAVGVLGYALYVLGVGAVLQTLAALPAQALNWLYTTVPAAQSLLTLMISWYQPLLWALTLVLLWQMFDHMPVRTQDQSLSS